MKAALFDRATGLAAFQLHLDELRTLLDDRRELLLLHVTCGELGLLETLYGWQVLDRVLLRAAEMIAALKGESLSARSVLALNGVSGEELLVFEPGGQGEAAPGAEEAAGLAGRIARALEEGFGGEEFAAMTPQLTFRVGWALVEENPQYRFERIVYRALEEARSQQARRERRRHEEWQAELETLIRRRGIVTRYQPIVRLDTFEILGYEALSGGCSPGPLVDARMLFELSERLGVCRELERICRSSALSGAGGLPGDAKLFLNTRPANLSDPEWGGTGLERSLAEAGLTPGAIVIEIPEGRIRDPQALAEPLAALRARGYRLALDDVGTGYSSLLAIESLKPDFIKVDVSIVRESDRSLLKQEVIASIRQIAARVRAGVIAEGIETAAELEVLRRAGVGFGQGYLFARPVERLEAGLSRAPERGA